MAHQYRQGRLVPTGETSARLAGSADRRGGGVSARRWTTLEHHEGGRGGLSIDRRDEPAHRRHGAMGARQRSVASRSIDAGAVRRGRSHSSGRGAAVADHAGVEPRDSAPGRRGVRFAEPRSRRPLARRRRARPHSGASLWPRFDKKTAEGENRVRECPELRTAAHRRTRADGTWNPEPEPGTRNPEPRAPASAFPSTTS